MSEPAEFEDRIRRRHVPHEPDGVLGSRAAFCPVCVTRWPCDPILAVNEIDALDQVISGRDRTIEALQRDDQDPQIIREELLDDLARILTETARLRWWHGDQRREALRWRLTKWFLTAKGMR